MSPADESGLSGALSSGSMSPGSGKISRTCCLSDLGVLVPWAKQHDQRESQQKISRQWSLGTECECVLGRLGSTVSSRQSFPGGRVLEAVCVSRRWRCNLQETRSVACLSPSFLPFVTTVGAPLFEAGTAKCALCLFRSPVPWRRVIRRNHHPPPSSVRQ
jgi:hypothetical protein